MQGKLKKADLFEFFRTIWRGWLTRMCGFLSVPFTFATIFAPPQYGPRIWGILACIAIFLTFYCVWKGERKRAIELQEKLEPKLHLSFRKDDLKCCPKTKIHFLQHAITSETRFGDSSFVSGGSQSTTNMYSSRITKEIEARYFRIAVEANGIESINDCRGFLTLIKKDSVVKMGHENLGLTFAPATSPDSVSKIIYNKVPEYLDILVVTEENKIHITTKDFFLPNSIDKDALFAEKGIYLIRVVVVGDHTVSSSIWLRLNWTGDWKTAEMAHFIDVNS